MGARERESEKGDTPMGKSVYDVIAERIIATLEKGEIPWRKPWSNTPPQNGEYRNPYRSINAFILHCAGYANPFWLTFNQAKKLGACVRKGEHGWPVVKWIFPDEDEAAKGKRPFPIYYTVFNVQQIDGLDMSKFANPSVVREHTPVEAAEKVIAGMPKRPTIKTGTRACYCPPLDSVEMPAAETFKSAEAYYRTLFHELVHSTGHETRLARKNSMEQIESGSEKYGHEELVAEMGAAFLAGAAGIDGSEGLEQSAAYVQHWLKAVKDDPRALVMAAAQAQKAADYILDRKAPEAVKSEDKAAEKVEEMAAAV